MQERKAVLAGDKFRLTVEQGSWLHGHFANYRALKASWENGMWTMPATPRNADMLMELEFDGDDLHAPSSLDWMEGSGLRWHQKAAISAAVRKHGIRALLADERGSGKKAQAAGILRSRPDILPALVICAASEKDGWQGEMRRWFPDAKACVLKGKNGAIAQGMDVVIVNYEILKSRKDSLGSYGFGTVVIDDCERLKDRKAGSTQAALEIAGGKHIIAITDLAVERWPMDFYNALNLLSPGYFGSYCAFGKRYGDPQENKYAACGCSFKGSSHTDELREHLSNWMIRRSLKEIKAGPPAPKPEQAPEPEEPEETFDGWDEEWIKDNCKRWAKGGRIRYYPRSPLRFFDLLGIEYRFFKTGNFSEVQGMSNTKARKECGRLRDGYYDAVEGDWHLDGSSLAGDIMEALSL